jgi:hypothetical protein
VGAMKGNSILDRLALMLNVEHVAALPLTDHFKSYWAFNVSTITQSLHNYGSQCRDYDEIR